MALPFHLLTKNQIKNICCEIHHLSFDFPTTPPGSVIPSVTVKTPIAFYEYDRVYVGANDVDLWATIIDILHGTGYKNTCAINYGSLWIIGNTNLKLNKKTYLQSKTRLINNEYFEDFCKDPKVIVERYFLTSKRDSTERKALINSYGTNIKKLLPYQRLKLSYCLLDTLNEYTSTLLKLHNRDLYLLNNHFYNAKEVNQNHLELLLREVEYTTKKMQNSHVELLATLDTCSKKIDKVVFNHDENKDEVASYLEQLKQARLRKKIIKCEMRHGVGSYHVLQQLKLLKKQMVRNKLDKARGFLIGQKMLTSWRLSLKRQHIHNRLALLFKYNSEFRVYLRTENNKIADELFLSKILLKLKMISPSKMRDMINMIQARINERYQPLIQKFEKARQMPQEKRMFFIKDTYARFFHKNNIQMLNSSLTAIKTILKFFIEDNRAHARFVQKSHELKWQYAKNKQLLKQIKIKSQNFNHQIKSQDENFKQTPYFDRSIKLLINRNTWLIKRIKKYLKQSGRRSTNSHVILFSNLAIIGLNDYSKYCDEFYKIYRVWKIWPFGTYAWFLNINWIFNVVLHYYENITENFVLKSKGVTSFININENRLRNIGELQQYLNRSFDNNINEIDRFLNRKYYLFTQLSKATVSPNASVDSYNPMSKFDNHVKLHAHFKTQIKEINKSIKNLKHKIYDINDVNKQKMLVVRKEYAIQLDEIRKMVMRFNHISKTLFKNVRIVNTAAYDAHFTTSKKIIDVRFIKRFATANINILNLMYKLVRFFDKVNHTNIYSKKRILAGFIRRCEFNNLLNNVGLSPIVLFDNYQELDKTELLRLYLAVQFFTKPSLVVYDNLPLNNEHEYNVVKGILLSEQNRLRFAILFMKISDQLAKDLALRSLSNR